MPNQIPQSLLNAFRSHKVVLFVGSGLSVNAGLPLWRELLNVLKAPLGLDRTDEAFFVGLDPPRQAQFLYDRRGKAAVIQAIRDIFKRAEQPSPPSAIHSTITALPIDTIVTSNWDTLLERQFEHDHISLDTIWRDTQLSTTTTRKTLIKMHGTIADPDSIVFSEDDYYRFANSNSIIKRYLATILAISTVLFVGYGHNDFDFKLIFHDVRTILNTLSRPSFIFIPNITVPEEAYLTKRGLFPISYHGRTQKAATNAFFRDLKQQVSVVAKTTQDRLTIMSRENGTMSTRAHGLLIRNQSNLGPLATPDMPINATLFGDRNITRLEVECAAHWKALLESGANARCIISLGDVLAHAKYTAADTVQRLGALRDNIAHYSAKVEVVDAGPPSGNNIDIYGNDCCLKSEKFMLSNKSYSRLRVVRDIDEIREAIETFDAKFLALRQSNLVAASTLFGRVPRSQEPALLHRYITHLLDERISYAKTLV